MEKCQTITNYNPIPTRELRKGNKTECYTNLPIKNRSNGKTYFIEPNTRRIHAIGKRRNCRSQGPALLFHQKGDTYWKLTRKGEFAKHHRKNKNNTDKVKIPCATYVQQKTATPPKATDTKPFCNGTTQAPNATATRTGNYRPNLFIIGNEPHRQGRRGINEGF